MHDPAAYPAFDAVAFGHRLEAARVLIGCKTRHRFIQKLARAGVRMDAKALQALEEGRAVPTYPFVAATIAVTKLSPAFFAESLSDALAEPLRRGA